MALPSGYTHQPADLKYEGTGVARPICLSSQELFMSVTLKPIDEQVMVITGASSGIGLCTAQSAAKLGAKVVLAARSDETLTNIVDAINASGGEAIAVP